mgnify:CR=1 FL=1
MNKRNYQLLLCENIMTIDSDEYILGDINGNGYLDNDDAERVLEYAARLRSLSDLYEDYRNKDKVSLGQFKNICDVNQDGRIDAKDARKIRRIIEGYETQAKTTFSHSVFTPVLELGSSTSESTGQAFNIEFYSKIDGTHELIFELPQFYFDENTGENIDNPLVKHVGNKCQLELRIDDKTYYMVVNSRTDEEEGMGPISYKYECTDAFIEELSKSGYGITFSDDVEGNGLGTIHDFSQQVAQGTEWVYDREKTGTLLEYERGLEWDSVNAQYKETRTPKPVHKVKYIPELGRYCNELKYFRENNGNFHKIYSYDDSEQITSDTVQNYLYNSDDFVDLVGWNTYTLSDTGAINYGPTLESVERTSEGKSYYCLKVDTSGDWYLINETTQNTNKTIKSGEPYVFKYEVDSGNQQYIYGIYIYSKDPRSYPDSLVYSKRQSYVPSQYYVIKTDNFISNPYIVFLVSGEAQVNFIAKNFEFFPVKGKKTDYYDADTNYLTLLSELANGNKVTSTQLEKMQTPIDIISSYTHKSTKYFIRDNYEVDTLGVETQIIKDSEKDTITYVDFIKEGTYYVDFIDCYILNNKVFSFAPSQDLSIVSSLPLTGTPSDIYKNTEDGKYYQYYTVDDGHGNTGSGWDYAFYDEGFNDKRRTLNLSKSNRFNIIQELAELFRVWPVFEMYRDENGETVKKFWYRENCITENFSGFHKGVNIESLSRIIDSNNIVTKMYVEDQDNEYVEDGFVTIRTSPLNPWGENYYYNFQYYVNQRLLDRISIETDLENLYVDVKGINYNIRETNEKIINAKPDLTDLGARLKSLAISIAACNERIASLQADIVNYQELDGEDVPDCQNSAVNVRRQMQQKVKFENEMATIQAKYDTLEKEIQEWQQKVEDLQSEKTNLIHEFENKYSQFIKEGVWADSSYIDNTQYYLDSLDVMNTSSMPQVEWKIEVIESSLIDSMEEFQFTVGDQTILVDNEFFMKEPNENYQFKVLITGTREYLDKPISNIIEVRNFFTSFEDIFQRVAAATQTLELKEQTYNKAEYFTQDGQIDQSILQSSMLNNALILANSTDNSYILDNTGLHLQSILNPAKKLRAIADGIFITNSKDPLTGEPKWMTGITADGINASMLTTGQINTSVIRIYTDGMPAFSWNNLGITAYKLKGNGTQIDSNSFIRLDSFGLYSVDGVDDSIYFNYDGAGNAWYKGVSYTDEDGNVVSGRDAAIQQILNHSTFSLTDKGFRLNISNPWTQGTATYRPYIHLGYAKDDPVTKMWAPLLGEPPEDLFGLYISDRSGLGHMVKLQSNGEDNLIAGWTINTKSLVNEQGGRDADGLFYEDCRIYAMKVPDSNLATETVLSIGKITKSGYRDMDDLSKGKYSTDEEWASTNFYVTADGTLHANALILGPNVKIGEDHLPDNLLSDKISQTTVYVTAVDSNGIETTVEVPPNKKPASYLYSYVKTTVQTDSSSTVIYKTSDNGGYVTVEKSFGTYTSDGSSKYFNLSKDGLLTAHNAVIYGKVVAGSGDIGGWEITEDILSSTYSSTGDRIYFASQGYTKSDGTRGDYWIRAYNTNTGTTYFGVKSNGKLYATAGDIAGWLIESTGLLKDYYTLDSDKWADYQYRLQVRASGSANARVFYVGRKKVTSWDDSHSPFYSYSENSNTEEHIFYVNSSGKLFAKNAEIEGHIKATSATIGGWTMDKNGTNLYRAGNNGSTVYLGSSPMVEKGTTSVRLDYYDRNGNKDYVPCIIFRHGSYKTMLWMDYEIDSDAITYVRLWATALGYDNKPTSTQNIAIMKF